MHRIVFGVLLVAALVTGLLAGLSHEPPARAPAVRTRVVDHGAPGSARAMVRDVAPVQRTGGVASTTEGKEESPETSGLLARMRRRLPGLTETQAALLAERETAYRRALKERAFDVADVLDADPARQYEAVAALRALRAERNAFVRDVLGAGAYETWRRVEIDGGRDVTTILQEMQEGGTER